MESARARVFPVIAICETQPIGSEMRAEARWLYVYSCQRSASCHLRPLQYMLCLMGISHFCCRKTMLSIVPYTCKDVQGSSTLLLAFFFSFFRDTPYLTKPVLLGGRIGIGGQTVRPTVSSKKFPPLEPTGFGWSHRHGRGRCTELI